MKILTGRLNFADKYRQTSLDPHRNHNWCLEILDEVALDPEFLN